MLCNAEELYLTCNALASFAALTNYVPISAAIGAGQLPCGHWGLSVFIENRQHLLQLEDSTRRLLIGQLGGQPKPQTAMVRPSMN